MRRLVIETATEALSLALFEDGKLLESFDALIGRGHAEQLVPQIAALPDGGRADEIRVDLGPGSFTGVRIGIAAARALAIAWNAKVLGFEASALVAVTARCRHPAIAKEPLLVVMEGGHGEWLVTPFVPGGALAATKSLLPAIAIACEQAIVIGSRAQDFVEMRGSGKAYPTHPSARYGGAIVEPQLTASMAPLYARPPDAMRMAPAIPATSV